MSLSRRGFLQGVLGLVAGLVGGCAAGTPPPVVTAPCPPAPLGPVDATTTLGEYALVGVGHIERFRLVGFQDCEESELFWSEIGRADRFCVGAIYGEPVALRQLEPTSRINRYKGEVLTHYVSPCTDE